MRPATNKPRSKQLSSNKRLKEREKLYTAIDKIYESLPSNNTNLKLG
jgi:hypothetical protein